MPPLAPECYVLMRTPPPLRRVCIGSWDDVVDHRAQLIAAGERPWSLHVYARYHRPTHIVDQHVCMWDLPAV